MIRLCTLSWLFLVAGVCSCRSDGPRPANPHPDQAVQACLAGMKSSRGQAAARRYSTIALACAGLYTEKPCRRVMSAQLTLPPDRRATVVAEACRRSYCPLLDQEPRPELCRLDKLPANPLELRRAWWELQWAILCRDLGPQRAARLYGVMLLADLARRPLMMTGPRLELKTRPGDHQDTQPSHPAGTPQP